MSGFLFLSDGSRACGRSLLGKHSFPHPVQFPAHAFDRALRLLLLRYVHLGHGFGEPTAGATQNGKRHLQIALDLFDHWRLH
jgi:hypothetical protein